MKIKVGEYKNIREVNSWMNYKTLFISRPTEPHWDSTIPSPFWVERMVKGWKKLTLSEKKKYYDLGPPRDTTPMVPGQTSWQRRIPLNTIHLITKDRSGFYRCRVRDLGHHTINRTVLFDSFVLVERFVGWNFIPLVGRIRSCRVTLVFQNFTPSLPSPIFHLTMLHSCVG